MLLGRHSRIILNEQSLIVLHSRLQSLELMYFDAFLVIAVRRQRDPQLRSAALFTIPEISIRTQMDTVMAESSWNGTAQFPHLVDPV